MSSLVHADSGARASERLVNLLAPRSGHCRHDAQDAKRDGNRAGKGETDRNSIDADTDINDERVLGQQRPEAQKNLFGWRHEETVHPLEEDCSLPEEEKDEPDGDSEQNTRTARYRTLKLEPALRAA